ncbi:ABC transporter substrate-binding protein [Nocardioides terrisoli]|uniref:ABC transporter substrate-binding protein n=1 Tax=Nocardioides terrisoli TaxID=3388267 RepID=UPI00287B77DB|nr:ABC transporter substrate-binding protein [Nocardioides marmorisolisilvae]
MKNKPLAAVFVAAGAAVTACGSGGGNAGSDAEGDSTTTVKVGVLPLADYSPVYWAKDKGLFEKHGLDVKLEPLQGGPVGVQKVVTGELQFSFANSISTTIAAAKGAPVQTVALGSSLGKGSNNIYVEADSPIKTLVDLDGRTVGTNTLSNVGDVAFANLAKSKGINAKPDWIEVPFPEMIPGVQNGSIEAGYVPEPFATSARQAGLREIVELVQGPNEALPVTTFVTSTQYAKSEPEVVQKFAVTMNEARAQIAANEDEFRSWLPKATGTDPAAAKEMKLPLFDVELDHAGMQRIADVLIGLHLIEGNYKVDDHIITTKD